MTKFKQRKSQWKPEDFMDHDFPVHVVSNSCENCVYANKDLKKSNICVKCLAPKGGKAKGKTQFKKRKRKKK